jgi:hypothetical protein
MTRLGFKLFFIGFNKCGTRSLHRYFSDCGLDSYHGGVYADSHQAIFLNIVRGEPALKGFDGHEVYLDVAAIQSQFRQLDRDYPGSRFVLNVRDINRWILSRLNHIDGRYVDYMNLCHGVELSWVEWADRWRREFETHERAVLEHFKDRPTDFLRFDIERDELAKLTAFVGAAGLEAPRALPRVNATERKHYALEGGRVVKLGGA